VYFDSPAPSLTQKPSLLTQKPLPLNLTQGLFYDEASATYLDSSSSLATIAALRTPTCVACAPPATFADMHQASSALQSLSREYGTYKTVKARVWLWLSGKCPEHPHMRPSPLCGACTPPATFADMLQVSCFRF